MKKKQEKQEKLKIFRIKKFNRRHIIRNAYVAFLFLNKTRKMREEKKIRKTNTSKQNRGKK